MKNYYIWALGLLLLFMLSGCTTNDTLFRITFVTNSENVVDEIIIKKHQILTLDSLPVLESDILYFHGWYIDKDFIIPYYEENITSDMTLYAMWSNKEDAMENKTLNAVSIVSETYQDIVLPKFKNNFSIIWSSSNDDIIDSNGKYKVSQEDSFITLTAKIITDREYQKDFIVKAKKFPFDEFFTLAFSTVSLTDKIEKDIDLKTTFNNNITGIWESSNPNIISSEGKVSLSEEEVSVTLTLTISLFEEKREMSYEVTTIPKHLSVQEPQYFINSLFDKSIAVDEMLMNESQINSYNNTVFNSSGTNVVLLDQIPETISKTDLISKINNYKNINSYTIYNNENNRAISNSEKQATVNNRNIDNISLENEIRYAVSITHTSLRSYPTMYYSNSNSIDRFQETGFSFGIPMIVYHQSLDNNWYFVQMYNYFGWVRASDVGLCNRDTFLNYLKPEKFVVVLANVLDVDGERIRMGYKIPYLIKNETNYLLKVPKRNTSGKLEILQYELPITSDVSDGFISFSYENLLTQAFKMLNISYSWGDKVANAFDCSSTQASIYGCFGFINGRNTSNQWKTDVYGKTLTSSITNDSLKSYQVGTLLYTSGHVLMYIGTDKLGNCWVLHNTSSGNICKVQTLDAYGTKSIIHVLEIRNIHS